MKLDPADIFGSAIGGVVARGVLAWLAVWLGMVGAAGLDAIGVVSLLILPLAILGFAVASGGAILVTLPLAGFLAYLALEFIRDEGSWWQLGLLMLLSLVVCLPASGDPSPLGILIFLAAGGTFAVHLRNSQEEKSGAGEDDR